MAVLEFFSQLENGFTVFVLGLLASYGGFGVLIGMFLESSIIPVPSEVILIAAGASGIPLWVITVYGAIGSTLGAMLGYYIGLKGGRPIIEKYGKYLFITQDRVTKAEVEVKKNGNKAILASRLIPFLPYKIFSITAGILRLEFKEFVIYTFIGSIPRCFLLAWLGSEIVKYKFAVYAIIAVLIIAAIVYFYHAHIKDKK